MITYSTYTDIGGRNINEDSLKVVDLGEKKLFVVADGLGGHGKGEVASSLVTEVISSLFSEKSSIKSFLEPAVIAAQDILMQKQVQLKVKDGMKTTVVALMIEKDKARWIHCGDSRIYRFYENKYVERSLDHSIPQMLVKTKDIREEDIRYHSERNMVLKVMGTKWESTECEIGKVKKIKKCQAFLLCTDGFWELITENYMEKFLRESSTVSDWLNKMVEVVKENGLGKNMDNNTAIAIWCE